MFLKRKSSAGAGFSHFVAAFIGRRGRRRCTDRTWSTPVGLYFSAAGEPTSAGRIGESGMRGGVYDLSSIILADQLATKFSPGSNLASPFCSHSACGHWNGRNPGGGTVDSGLVPRTLLFSVSSIRVIIGCQPSSHLDLYAGGQLPPPLIESLVKTSLVGPSS